MFSFSYRCTFIAFIFFLLSIVIPNSVTSNFKSNWLLYVINFSTFKVVIILICQMFDIPILGFLARRIISILFLLFLKNLQYIHSHRVYPKSPKKIAQDHFLCYLRKMYNCNDEVLLTNSI